jgi:hypothetical protein
MTTYKPKIIMNGSQFAGSESTIPNGTKAEALALVEQGLSRGRGCPPIRRGSSLPPC